MKILSRTWKRLRGISPEKWTDSEKVDAYGLDMKLDQIADLYKVMDWKMDLGDSLGVPDEEHLIRVIVHLIQSIKVSEHSIAFATMGRLMVYTDPDFPSYWNVCIDVGMIPRNGD